VYDVREVHHFSFKASDDQISHEPERRLTLMICMFPTHIPMSKRRHVQIGCNLLYPDTSIHPTSRPGIRTLGRKFIDSWTEG
jgi:hypothetical protein